VRIVRLANFVHSGTNAIETCFAIEFCTSPIEVTFTQAQARVSAFAGFDGALGEAVTVVMRGFAADGAHIAFTSERDGNREVYVARSDGGNVRRLTNDPAKDASPAWSPDGSRILFVSARTGTPELHLMKADGLQVEKLTSGAHSSSDVPRWASRAPPGRGLAERRSNSTSGKISFKETRIALPIAVPFCNWMRSSAARMSSRFNVGVCTTEAVAANATTPIRVSRGCAAMKFLAAALAAAIRVGAMSAARMLPEASIARITVSYWYGRLITDAGRAIATIISTSASSIRTGGKWRRSRGAAPCAFLTSARRA